MKKLGCIGSVIFYVNSLVAFLLLLSFVLPYLPPNRFPTVSVLSLGVAPLIILNVIFMFYWGLRLRKQFLLSLIVLILASINFASFIKLGNSKTTNTNKESIRVATYNVRLFNQYESKEKRQEAPKVFAEYIEEVKPDIVLVHGDTSTTFVTSLACFYLQIPVGHVEAGLRTHNIFSPFPEEFNRQAVGLVAKYHFSPTKQAKENLLREGKKEESIFVTGNTVIDALSTTVKEDYTHEHIEWSKGSRLIMITAHRRENLGEPMRHMFRAIKRIVDETPDIKEVYPIHMNPMVREAANEILGNNNRIRIIEPLEVLDFHNFMARSYLILTDSGGVQEEAPSLGKPVLVMRDTTERPEGITAGTLKLVGTNEEIIYSSFKELLEDEKLYKQMSKASNPYGDGDASKRITDILEA